MNLNARLTRNRFREVAGEYFQYDGSPLLEELNSDGINALVGIQRGDGAYTILSYDQLHYRTDDGTVGSIDYKDILEKFRDISFDNGKKKKYEYFIFEKDRIWFHNESVFCAFWNTVSFLHQS